MLIKRNLKIFFRDRAGVFFSMLSPLILIVLYILFIGNLMEANISAMVEGGGTETLQLATTSIVMSGMVGMMAISTSLGAIGIAVQDKQNKGAGKDFIVSPAPRRSIIASYIGGASIISLIMTGGGLVLTMVYLGSRGGVMLDAPALVLLLFTLCLGALAATAVFFFISLFMTSMNAFSGLSAMFGALLGFFMGVFFPPTILPMAVQWVIMLFPFAHLGSMFRLIIAQPYIEQLFRYAPAEYMESFMIDFGILFRYGDFVSNFWFSTAVVALTAALFFIAGFVVLKRRKAK